MLVPRKDSIEWPYDASMKLKNAQVHLYMHNKAAAEQAHQLKDSCSKKIWVI